MEEKDKVRLDKWLWSVRIYKTRSQATEACRKGRIMINGTEAKPSREVRRGDTILIRKLPVIYTFQVKELVENRLPAKRIHEFYDDITAPEELEKLKLKDTAFFKRDRGTGRPTKKERRLLSEIINQE
ncbi:MAG: RNA-binding S4 domain-containing protein [Bacteroidales bacterium]|nr:RNA-binding S4 domain-containing protein [Bacteroidales bacterium]